jgi:2-(1,2-epoxy-1,2-dihydrophenyl)acetyl-CoA isomerase
MSGDDNRSAGITVTSEAGVVRIGLDRGTANAFDLPMAEAFGRELRNAVAGRARLVVLRGGDRFFSAGGDLRGMRDAIDPGAYVRAVADAMHGGLDAIANSDTLFLTAIRGTVAGAGLGIVLHADVSVCADDATFRAGYGAAGLTPDMGLSYLLPRSVGEVRARRLLLLGEPVDAASALAWGLVTEVTKTAELDSRVDALVAVLSKAPAANATKGLLVGGRIASLSAQLAAEAESISRLFTTDDARLRVSAFLER